MNLLQTFNARLPSHGYATDDLTRGVRFVPLSVLIQKAIIQFNWRHSVGFLAYDVDSGTALFDWDDNRNPPPNILVWNPNNGHAHYLYGLKAPVHKYNDANPKPLRYLAAVDVAMTAELHADPGYSKLLCKNPMSDRWIVSYPRRELYDLDELASWIEMTPYEDRRRRLPAIGLGRNCLLFEDLRRWAYRARRQPYLSEELFQYRVLCQGLSINAEFSPPLAHNEVRSTVKSISRWTWRNMSNESFNEWQRANGKRSGAIRHAKAMELRKQIIETARQCPTLVQADIAAIHGVTQQTVSNHLRDYARTISDKDQYKRTISDNSPERRGQVIS